MKLKSIGSFRELEHGDPTGPSLVALVGDKPRPDEARIADYLRGGLLMIGCPGVVGDILDEAAGLIGSPHIMTDGVWAWPGDLPYYLEKYHLALPDDFIAHARARAWNPPAAGEIDLSDLEL